MSITIRPGRIRGGEAVDETSDPVIVNGLSPVTVYLDPGGTAKVQYTTSPMDTADEIAAAVWRDWSAGEVTVPTESVFDGKITVLRAVNVIGSGLDWEVVA